MTERPALSALQFVDLFSHALITIPVTDRAKRPLLAVHELAPLTGAVVKVLVKRVGYVDRERFHFL
jgi:hypothetical protein